MIPDSGSIWLVVGLGNPGDDYASTYHNLGFATADLLARRSGPAGARWERMFGGRIRKPTIAGVRTVLLKPMTYMNLSGESVGPARGHLGIGVDRIVVIHDDVDLPPGDVRVKLGGGAGGHHGVESCIGHLGDPGFVRVRIGIGRHDRMPTERYVLTRIPGDQKEIFEGAVERAADAVEMVLARGPAAAMNEVNRRDARGGDDGAEEEEGEPG